MIRKSINEIAVIAMMEERAEAEIGEKADKSGPSDGPPIKNDEEEKSEPPYPPSRECYGRTGVGCYWKEVSGARECVGGVRAIQQLDCLALMRLPRTRAPEGQISQVFADILTSSRIFGKYFG